VGAGESTVTIAMESDGVTNDDGAHANLKRCRLPDGMVVLERRAVVPAKWRRRRHHFISVPMVWFERLEGASGQTYRIALHLLYLDWRARGEPIQLANGLLRIDGVSRYSKWRALDELERRGLIAIEPRPRRSPIVTLLKLS
jgi:hypothetical protein